MEKKLEREARIALWTLKFVPLHVMVKSEPFPVLRRLGYIRLRHRKINVSSYFANPSISSDLETSIGCGSSSDKTFLLDSDIIVVSYKRRQII